MMKNRIDKDVTVKAPIDRVWQALTDYREFGTWFRVALEEPFAVGRVTRGTTTYPGYEGRKFWARTVTMDGPHLFVFDWPYGPDIMPELADEPGVTTRVEFRLETAGAGTRIRLTETGFDMLPVDKSAEQFRNNDGGWTIQMQNIRTHVDG
ncbi:MAG: SRPBCC family protein [Paracoccaceae bacterium]